jgi:hypothetical protein
MVATQSIRNGVKAMARRSADGAHHYYVHSLVHDLGTVVSPEISFETVDYHRAVEIFVVHFNLPFEMRIAWRPSKK